MSYTPRLTSDGIANNPKWYSSNPFYTSGYGLPNCTCYAWGRFWEISDPSNQGVNRPNLSLGNAKEWWQYNINNQIYDYGQTPQLGATICFAPPALYPNRVGHVATVEEIYSDHIVTSNSDWGGRYFYLEDLYPDSMGQYHHDVYTSQGFIYNPWAEQPVQPIIKTKKQEFPWPIAWHHWQNFKK